MGQNWLTRRVNSRLERSRDLSGHGDDNESPRSENEEEERVGKEKARGENRAERVRVCASSQVGTTPKNYSKMCLRKLAVASGRKDNYEAVLFHLERHRERRGKLIYLTKEIVYPRGAETRRLKLARARVYVYVRVRVRMLRVHASMYLEREKKRKWKEKASGT